MPAHWGLVGWFAHGNEGQVQHERSRLTKGLPSISLRTCSGLDPIIKIKDVEVEDDFDYVDFGFIAQNCANGGASSTLAEIGGDAMAETHVGTCFCGTVAIGVTGAPEEMGYCHCNSCRSYSGGPVNAFTLWKAENVKVTKGAESLGRFNKTEFSGRRFCTRCGGHVMVDHPTLGLIDVHASTIPSLAFKPSVHLNYAETVLPMRDGLPKLKDFPAAVGGSGETVPE